MQDEEKYLMVEGRLVRITHPQKLLWPDIGLTKWEYVTILARLAPYILPHAKDRYLTTIRYPQGITGECFYQKNIPVYAPEWVSSRTWNNTRHMVLDSLPTLLWLANQSCLEFHVSFHPHHDEQPSALVFDLDPNEVEFDRVAEAALYIRELMHTLGYRPLVKTSGATGLQIYLPIRGHDFEEARKVNLFFATYFRERYPHLFTIERAVRQRGPRVYFDYLQMWRGKSLTLVYSPRARKGAPVSTPIEWEELERGIHPRQFHLRNIGQRLREKGDLFAPLLDPDAAQSLSPILEMLRGSRFLQKA